MAAFGEERPLPQFPKRLQHLEGFERCKCGVWAASPTPLGIPRPPLPPPRNPAPLGEPNAPSAAGREHHRAGENLPGVTGEEPNTRPAPSSLSRGMLSRTSTPLPPRLREGCSGTAGGEKSADLRPGEPRECHLFRGKLFASRKLRAPGKCLTASHGAGPCRSPPVPAASASRSLAAPPGTAGKA